MKKVIDYVKRKPVVAVYILVLIVLIGMLAQNKYNEYKFEQAGIRGKQINDSLKRDREERAIKENIETWGPNYKFRIDSVNRVNAKKDQENREKQMRKDYGEMAWKLYKKHPEWSIDDCRRIINKEIWIGMDIDMVITMRGRPDSRNLSNYGRGDEYQYCWHEYTPSCFYCGTDDIVKSYN